MKMPTPTPVRFLILLGLLTLSIPAVCIAAPRQLPELPPAGERIRVIIDTDTANEIDDIYALALALVAQDRFDIEGIVAAHYGDSGGPDGIENSVALINEVLEKAGMAGRFPVKTGSPPFQYSTVPPESEGVDFIIERAMAEDQDRPLWVIALGPCTDLAAAYLKEPKIANRIVAFWHGRTQWPLRCWNFNAYNDVKAVRIVFRSELPFVLFDTGTYLRCPMDESEAKLLPHGELGRYLHEYRLRKKYYQSPKKGFFDLGDIAALIDPSLVYSEIVAAPDVEWDLTYNRAKNFGPIRRIYQIDRDHAFAMFSDRLKAASLAGP